MDVGCIVAIIVYPLLTFFIGVIYGDYNNRKQEKEQ